MYWWHLSISFKIYSEWKYIMRLDIQLMNVMGDLCGCAYEIDKWQFQTFLQHNLVLVPN